MSNDLNPRFTFDTFVVGASNRLAVAACRSVAENPATTHNPLFIYSQTGLGKTHLIMAIGQRALELGPNLIVEYLTLDAFVEGYHAAVSLGRIEDFRRRYSEADLMLIDDVQFLAHRQETQSELLRFATELQESGTQVVLTSDRSPAEIADLDERLIKELAGGLVVDIGPPDFETRLAILNRRAEERGVQLARDVLEVVANYDVQNVRELIGILNRLIAFQAVSENTLSPETARVLLEGGAAAASAEPVATSDAPPPDEFGDFLSGVTETVTKQVEAWRANLGQAIQQWANQGYRTAKLHALLEHEDPSEVDQAVKRFEAAVSRLRTSEQTVAGLDPTLAQNPVFRDPDRLVEAEALVEATKTAFVAPPAPSDEFSLDAFETGASSKMARGAAVSIVEQPGTLYNPLVLVGPSGVGKTHLLHAIGRELEGKGEGRWVACVSAQGFLDELVHAIEEDHVAVWRARYRQASAFLLDNIDALATRDRIQEELFYLFNVLADSERQLVFTSSVAPRDIEGLDDRLRSRLEGGLIATLDVPSPDLKRAIIADQLASRVGQVDAALVEFLANQPAESVRSVLGLGQRVLTAAEAQAVAPDVPLATEVLQAASSREARARSSSVVMAPSGGIDSGEKMVWRWPDSLQYVIEDPG